MLRVMCYTKSLCIYSGLLGVGAPWTIILQWWPDSSKESHRPDVMSSSRGAACWEPRGQRQCASHRSHTGAGGHWEYSWTSGSVAPPSWPGPRQPRSAAKTIWDAHRSVPAASAAAHSHPPPPAEATGSLCWPRTWLSFSPGEQLGTAAQSGTQKSTVSSNMYHLYVVGLWAAVCKMESKTERLLRPTNRDPLKGQF